MKPKRMTFIPDLKAVLVKKLGEQGVDEPTVQRAFEQWEAGGEPRTPWERGCFAAFEYVQKNVEAEDA